MKLPSEKDVLSNTEQLREKITLRLKNRKAKILLTAIGALVVGTTIFFAKGFVQNLRSVGFSWCTKGNDLELKGNIINALGVEDYKSSQFEEKVCHLSYTKNNFTIDFYLDEKALAKFGGSRDKDIGNGCLVFNTGSSQSKTELCFGEKIKKGDTEEKRLKVDNDLLSELEKIATSSLKKISIPPSQKSVNFNFAGTKWSYQIQAGGGVGGVMTFEKDEGGSLRGTFTENGPEGQKKKKFVGSREEDNFLLTLEEFPTFEIVLSADGKTMTGKPVEPEKDIFYPDDFFKATKM